MTDILFRLALNYGCRPHLGSFHTANCLRVTSREKSGAEVKLQGTNRWPAHRRLLRCHFWLPPSLSLCVVKSSIKRDVKKKSLASTEVEMFSRDPAHWN